MRKLLLLLCVVLSGCEMPKRNNDKSIPFSYITEFKYKDHSYVKFSGGHEAGVVHDPDCGCGGAR